jgi:hypothetical protein
MADRLSSLLVAVGLLNHVIVIVIFLRCGYRVPGLPGSARDERAQAGCSREETGGSSLLVIWAFLMLKTPCGSQITAT